VCLAVGACDQGLTASRRVPAGDTSAQEDQGAAAPPPSTLIRADFSIEPSNQPRFPLNLLLKGQQLRQVCARAVLAASCQASCWTLSAVVDRCRPLDWLQVEQQMQGLVSAAASRAASPPDGDMIKSGERVQQSL
jgi:hypothetical protein